jgi:hypothetical protein
MEHSVFSTLVQKFVASTSGPVKPRGEYLMLIPLSIKEKEQRLDGIELGSYSNPTTGLP